jgi:hypothetical protein
MIDYKTVKPTKAECEKVLRLLKKQRGVTAREATSGYGPQLVMDWDWFGDGPRPAIVWEGGPYDWVMYLPYGGVEEEWGVRLTNVSDGMPKGVWVEAATSWAVHIHKEVPA